MLEYSVGIFRLGGRFPREVVLYIGEPPLRMQSELFGPGMSFRCHVVDIRTLDGERLLESSSVGDNVIGILARLRDHRGAIRKTVKRIARLPPGEQASAFEQLLILAGLRRLENEVEEEARHMPIHIDILENRVLGREYKRGLEEGKREGRQEGELQGEHKGELALLRRQLQRRFGAIPEWAEERLTAKRLTSSKNWASACSMLARSRNY